MAPFEVIITPIGYDKSSSVKEGVDDLYQLLIAEGYDVLLDDRGLRPGIMFSEAELIGIPHRITVSENTLNENKYEYKNRSKTDAEMIASNDLIRHLKSV